MKVKAILATAVLAVSGAANAAIEGPVGSNTIDSDLVLTIYDSSLDVSYVQDLEVNYLDIIGAGGSFTDSFNLDAAALSIFSGSNQADLSWSLVAAGQDFLLPGSQFGTVTTAVDPFALDFGSLSATATAFNNLATVANLDPAIGGSTDGGATSGVTGSILSFEAGAFNSNIRSTVGFANSANVNEGLMLYWIHLDDNFVDVAPELATQVAWNLDLANATLSAVPIPAAVWLFVSGLLGLGAISRRRQA